MKIGYMRVSTDQQDNALQEDALRRAGCEKIYSDKLSGKTTTRPGFDQMMADLKAGDQLVVWKLDRLGRSTIHVIQTANFIGERGIDLISLTENIDTTNPMGRFVFRLMASLAELEREIIAERTKAGIAAARARSAKPWGRQPEEVPPEVVALLAEGLSVREIEKRTGVNRGKVHRMSMQMKAAERVGDLV